MTRKATDILHALRSDTDLLANSAHGSDIYVIRSIRNLIQGIEVMTEQIMQVYNSVGKFENQVIKFAKAADKTEAIMKQLTIVGLVVAVAQLVLAATIWFATK
jgi:hypothetical protein